MNYKAEIIKLDKRTRPNYMLPIGICVKYNTIKLKDGKKYIMLILTQKSPWNGNINVRKGWFEIIEYCQR